MCNFPWVIQYSWWPNVTLLLPNILWCSPMSFLWYSYWYVSWGSYCKWSVQSEGARCDVPWSSINISKCQRWPSTTIFKGCEGSIHIIRRCKYAKTYLNEVCFKAMNFFSMNVIDHEMNLKFFSFSFLCIYASMINKVGIGTLCKQICFNFLVAMFYHVLIYFSCVSSINIVFIVVAI